MNAAQRAAAMAAGLESECPRCGGIMPPPVDVPPIGELLGVPFGGGKVVHCLKCGWTSDTALAAVAGKPSDETAAIWVKP